MFSLLPLMALNNFQYFILGTFFNFILFLIINYSLANTINSWIYGVLSIIIFSLIGNFIISIIPVFVTMILIYFYFAVRKELSPLMKYSNDILFFFAVLIILTSILSGIPINPEAEQILVITIILIVTIFLSVYAIKLPIEFLMSFSKNIDSHNNINESPKSLKILLVKNILLIVPIIGIVVFLILPDLIYAYFIYDIYLSVIKHAQIDFIDLFYYSVNIHFNTPMPGINQEYIEQLFSTNIGKVIKICHLVLIKLIDVIIIGTLAGLFIEYIRSFKK